MQPTLAELKSLANEAFEDALDAIDKALQLRLDNMRVQEDLRRTIYEEVDYIWTPAPHNDDTPFWIPEFPLSTVLALREFTGGISQLASSATLPISPSVRRQYAYAHGHSWFAYGAWVPQCHHYPQLCALVAFSGK